MKTYLLEIAAFTLDGVLNAIEGGADRIELCENPSDGGTTPSFGMLSLVKQLTTIPVFPIIRPRGGNFVYSANEIEVMKEDIRLCNDLGFEGIVLGILDTDGQIDIKKTSQLIMLASPMNVTFHRAFDRCIHPEKAIEELIDCGCRRILTSGQYPSVYDGKELVRKLVEQSADRIIIMPGSGLNSGNIKEIALYTKANEFHTAARKKQLSDSIVSPISMNELLAHVSVDKVEVAQIRKELNSLAELF